jgi:hypothetical protein
MILTTTLLALALAADEAPAAEPLPPPPVVEAEPPVIRSTETAPPIEVTVGGAIAPPILPRGAMSVYALLGAPDIGVGWRQGFDRFEVEARALLNYFTLSAVVELGGKMSVFKKGPVEFVPNVAIGIEGDSGARYFDKANFAYFALRPRAGLITGIRFTDIATGLLLIDLPWAIPLTNGAAGGHFTPTIGAGAEIQLGGNISGLVAADAGIDLIKEPLGVTQLRLAWGVRLGLGFRLFK